jgi:hypothetical protein
VTRRAPGETDEEFRTRLVDEIKEINARWEQQHKEAREYWDLMGVKL